MNPLFNAMQNNGGPQMGGPMGNIQNLMQQINQFKEQFQGDPKAKVEELMKSGQMSQEQYNQAAQFANQMMGFFKG